MDDQNKNLLLATVLSFMVILTWFILFPPPEATPTDAEVAGDGTVIQTEDGAILPSAGAADPTTQAAPEAEEITEAPRIAIETDHLLGSISLQGGRIDDLDLVQYQETLDPESDLVHHLNPVGGQNAYYALYGWAPSAGMEPGSVPGPNTLWNIESGGTLSTGSPVSLVWDNGAGLIFRRSISVDENYMFTINQSVENTSQTPVSVAAYGLVARHGEPDVEGFFISHEGLVRMVDGEREALTYDDMTEFDGGQDAVNVTDRGWIGFVDKYWMTTLIPEQGQAFRADARFIPGNNIYQTGITFPTVTVAPGAVAEANSQLFAGAKEWEAIRNYQNEDGIDRFLDSIDWGWFFFLTKPIFWLLHNINAVIGNMGWSIVVLTLIIKAILLPLAYKSYVSMAKMKELQPEMEKLKESAGDDRQKLQQGMMKLYKDNKVNPASGCLPILLQIPIFFSLYKVIFVTLELRHAPWIGWIKDLSAPDPSSIFNLWGIMPWGLPWDPHAESLPLLAFLFIGILPLCLGLSMWLQQKLNPAPTDPTQKAIFAWMPWVFMFMLGSFASGLVIYWIANNMITFTQQYLIMRANGHRPDLFGNIASSFKRTSKAAAANSDSKPKGK